MKLNIMSSEAKVFETGEYQNDFGIGKWNYNCEDVKIGDGLYNKGVKIKVNGSNQMNVIIVIKRSFIMTDIIQKVGRQVQGIFCMIETDNQNKWKNNKIISEIVYIVVVDHIIKKEIRKKLEIGQNYMKGFLFRNKSVIMANIIQIV
ncbi:unnamed protein product [Paramecium sonneborni]|uniref:Uncharacterized protein n=1 Tax=Paramecium sonneborni TaxID=65129 RepID=A0A8S1LR32_9CILI|nr:unnamed protein product [Paramecium sonneborni]